MTFNDRLTKKFSDCLYHYGQYPDLVILGRKQWVEMVNSDFKDYHGIDGNWVIKSRPLYYASHINNLFLCIPRRILP
jgi:hypothetical protein